MFWILLIVAVIGYSLFRFFISYSKDNDELQSQTLDQKFEVIVQTINNAAFDGNGSITTLDKREFNLYEEGKNQIIKFQYSTGHLTITWNYKYFQKEVVNERQFDNVRNLSVFEQQDIGNGMIKEMAGVVERHKNEVLGVDNEVLVYEESIKENLLSEIKKNIGDFKEGDKNWIDSQENLKKINNDIGTDLEKMKLFGLVKSVRETSFNFIKEFDELTKGDIIVEKYILFNSNGYKVEEIIKGKNS